MYKFEYRNIHAQIWLQKHSRAILIKEYLRTNLNTKTFMHKFDYKNIHAQFE